MPESPLKKTETKTNAFIDLTLSVALHPIRMFLTLVTTNITLITIGGHKNLTIISTKTQFLLERHPEEDYQLVLLPG